MKSNLDSSFSLFAVSMWRAEVRKHKLRAGHSLYPLDIVSTKLFVVNDLGHMVLLFSCFGR